MIKGNGGMEKGECTEEGWGRADGTAERGGGWKEGRGDCRKRGQREGGKGGGDCGERGRREGGKGRGFCGREGGGGGTKRKR